MKDSQQQLDSNIHPSVVGFMSAFKKGDHIGPRTWQRVSDMIRNSNNRTQLAEDLKPIIGGDLAVQLVTYHHTAAQLPSIDDILLGKITKLEVADHSMAYALTTAMCYELNDRYIKFKNNKGWQQSPEFKAWLQQADHFVAFILDNMSPEHAILAIRAAVQIFKLPFVMARMPGFLEFANRYRSLVMA